jgi:hypothetical protein
MVTRLDSIKFVPDLEIRGDVVNGLYRQTYDPDLHKVRRQIELSDRIFKPGYGREQLYSETTGFKTSCGQSHTGAQSVLAHEFGHHIDYVLRTAAVRGELGELWDTIGTALGVEPPVNLGDIAMKSWFNKNSAIIKQKVSGYAATNQTEFLAEIWREYSGNPKARAEIKLIGKKFHDLAKALVP